MKLQDITGLYCFLFFERARQSHRRKLRKLLVFYFLFFCFSAPSDKTMHCCRTCKGSSYIWKLILFVSASHCVWIQCSGTVCWWKLFCWAIILHLHGQTDRTQTDGWRITPTSMQWRVFHDVMWWRQASHTEVSPLKRTWWSPIPSPKGRCKYSREKTYDVH